MQHPLVFAHLLPLPHLPPLAIAHVNACASAPRLSFINIQTSPPRMLPTRCIPRLRLLPRRPRLARRLVTLAIETSCDDTAVAVLSQPDIKSPATLVFNERISSDNRAFQGVHPLISVQGHHASLGPLVRRAIKSLPGVKPDFVSVTRGPGIMANLAVGLTLAKGLAVAWDVPLLAVHHMQGHALTPRLAYALENAASGVDFPFLSLLVSGGHTQLVLSSGLTDHSVLANSGDTAVGNLLDQTARVILPPDVLASSEDVMYGRLLESFAFSSPDEHAGFFTPPVRRQDEIDDPHTGYEWKVSVPFRNSRKLAYSFSSIHSRVHDIARDGMSLEERRSLARHTMRAAFVHIASRLCCALQDHPRLQGKQAPSMLVVAGGVASNKFLMHVLHETLAARGFGEMRIIAPPPALCTDNAAMIAWTGMEMYRAGWRSDLSVRPIAKWSMDPDVMGILGIDGWLRSECV